MLPLLRKTQELVTLPPQCRYCEWCFEVIAIDAPDHKHGDCLKRFARLLALEIDWDYRLWDIRYDDSLSEWQIEWRGQGVNRRTEVYLDDSMAKVLRRNNQLYEYMYRLVFEEDYG